MAKRNIVWTKTADIQFAGILEYWNIGLREINPLHIQKNSCSWFPTR